MKRGNKERAAWRAIHGQGRVYINHKPVKPNERFTTTGRLSKLTMQHLEPLNDVARRQKYGEEKEVFAFKRNEDSEKAKTQNEAENTGSNDSNDTQPYTKQETKDKGWFHVVDEDGKQVTEDAVTSEEADVIIAQLSTPENEEE